MRGVTFYLNEAMYKDIGRITNLYSLAKMGLLPADCRRDSLIGRSLFNPEGM